MLGFNMVSAPIIYYWLRGQLSSKGKELAPQDFRCIDPADLLLIRSFAFLIFSVWGALYILNVAYSGGIPLLWAVMHSGKTYADFGIPSVGGLALMLRSFVGVVWMCLFCITGQKKYLLFVVGLGSLCILEVSRGNLFMYILQIGCIYLILNRMRIRTFLVVAAIVVIAISLFIFLGTVRGITGTAATFGAGKTAIANIPPGLFWAWAYTVSTIGNVNHAAAIGIHPHYFPLYSGTLLLPGAIRGLFGASGAPIPLAASSLTAVSAYGPLIADFGFSGAAIWMAGFQALSTYVYIRAKQGSLVHLVIYPPLFVSIVLSVFNLYAMSMMVVTYPWVAITMRNYVARKRSTAASGMGAPDAPKSPRMAPGKRSVPEYNGK